MKTLSKEKSVTIYGGGSSDACGVGVALFIIAPNLLTLAFGAALCLTGDTQQT